MAGIAPFAGGPYSPTSTVVEGAGALLIFPNSRSLLDPGMMATFGRPPLDRGGERKNQMKNNGRKGKTRQDSNPDINENFPSAPLLDSTVQDISPGPLFDLVFPILIGHCVVEKPMLC